MRIKRLFVVTGVFAIMLYFLTVGTGYAQAPDLSMWNGTWFQLSQKSKGYGFDGLKMIKDRVKGIGYLQLGDWDGGNEWFPVDVWVYDDQGGWTNVPMTVHFHGGTPLDFVCWVWEEDSFGQTIAFTARIQGIEDTGVPGDLIRATFKTLGGCYWKIDGGLYFAGGESLRGNMIEASQVPVP
jgi:hypothetical protein